MVAICFYYSVACCATNYLACWTVLHAAPLIAMLYSVVCCVIAVLLSFGNVCICLFQFVVKYCTFVVT